MFKPWPSETDLFGTFYETPQNHLVDFLTLLPKLQRETSPKNLLKPLPFFNLRTRKAGAYQRLLTFFCIAYGNKMPVLLSANNIRLLTKCDAALLSFRYTSFNYSASFRNDRFQRIRPQGETAKQKHTKFTIKRLLRNDILQFEKKI